VKELVYVPPIARDVDELKAQITEYVATIDNAMLKTFDNNLTIGMMCVV
jgi:hypothetical protein